MSYLKNTINKEVKEEILTKVKEGQAVMTLAKQYGISDKTIYGWLRGKVINNVSFLEFAKLRKENQILKEIVGVLTVELEKTKKRIDLSTIILERVPQATKSFICSLLNICRNGFYKQRNKLKQKDELLKNQILKVLEFNPVYGHRRIAIELKVGKNRVSRFHQAYLESKDYLSGNIHGLVYQRNCGLEHIN